MQKFIDIRAQEGERDELPTTAQLKEFADEPDEMNTDETAPAQESPATGQTLMMKEPSNSEKVAPTEEASADEGS